jgi:hypothetical protein
MFEEGWCTDDNCQSNGLMINSCSPSGTYSQRRCMCSLDGWNYPPPPKCTNRVARVSELWC